MRKSLLDLLESSSLPGVPVLIKSKQLIVKIVWLLGTVIMLGLSIKYIIDSIQSYYNFEVVTSINVFKEKESQFPAVSFYIQYNENSTNLIKRCFT